MRAFMPTKRHLIGSTEFEDLCGQCKYINSTGHLDLWTRHMGQVSNNRVMLCCFKPGEYLIRHKNHVMVAQEVANNIERDDKAFNILPPNEEKSQIGKYRILSTLYRSSHIRQA